MKVSVQKYHDENHDIEAIGKVTGHVQNLEVDEIECFLINDFGQKFELDPKENKEIYKTYENHLLAEGYRRILK